MKLKIPGDGSQITLQQFMDYHNAVDDIERVMVIINKSREYCESLKADSVQTIITLFEEVIDASASKFERVTIINGKRLGFIPDINGMTFREHVDLDSLAKVIWHKDGKVNYKEFPRLMAILFRPVTEQVGDFYNVQKYDAAKMSDYMQEVMGLTLEQVNGALVFFSSIGAELVNNSLDYLDKMMTRELSEIIRPQDSQNGAGITYSSQ
jgi:hypothetical protein